MGDFPQELWVFGAFPMGHELLSPAGVPHEVERGCDGPPGQPPRIQPEGEIANPGSRFAGWSYVSWWDSQGDQRHNSHTGILARGTWERWQLVEEGRRRFPWAFRVPLGAWAERPAAAVTVADVIASEQANALRDIATIIGCPANADPLTDLDGLVMAVRGLAERVVGVEARIADAVAVDRMAIGTWLRNLPRWSGDLARSIEHGDHIDDNAPPLPNLRMVLLLRDELLRQVEVLTAERDDLRAEVDKRTAPHCQHAMDSGHDIGHGIHPDRGGPSALDAEIERLTAERDRRIEPVEHARAVMRAYLLVAGGLMWRWARSPAREELLARVGADVLAEVER